MRHENAITLDTDGIDSKQEANNMHHYVKHNVYLLSEHLITVGIKV